MTLVICAGCCLCLLFTLFFWYIYNKDKKVKDTEISFREAMALIDLPVVTFEWENKKLVLLLDTGCNQSVINSSALTNLKYKSTGLHADLFGIEGQEEASEAIVLQLGYKDNMFTEVFMVKNLDKAFALVKKESGIQIHGILGSDFLEKHKYILNFKTLTAYKGCQK